LFRKHAFTNKKRYRVMLKAKEFTLELEKIDAGENPLRLEGENKGIAELAASISRIGLNPGKELSKWKNQKT
jgi:hypothetical protein